MSSEEIVLEIQDLLNFPQEKEAVELKPWLDLSDNKYRAAIARHLAALANGGGGYLLFGWNDDGSQCEKKEDVLQEYSSDVIGGIVDRYLIPKFQCQVFFEKKNDIVHPVIRVPTHGTTPVIARADGPHDGQGRPQEIVCGRIYIRSPKPESVPITLPDQWGPLIQRCVLARRDDLLGMISSLMSPNAATVKSIDSESHLLEWHNALRQAFISKTREAGLTLKHPIEENNVQFSYILIGPEKGHLSPTELIQTVEKANNATKDTVSYGWSMFHPFTRPPINPVFLVDPNLSSNDDFLQANLIESSATNHVDFWRIAPDGRAGLIRNFHEDRFPTPQSLQPNERWFDPWLHVRDLTELVRHAHALAEITGGVEEIMFCVEWTGLSGRCLCASDPRRYWSPRHCTANERKIVKSFPFAQVVADLPTVVAQLYAPVHRLFDPSTSVTDQFISRFLPSYKAF